MAIDCDVTSATGVLVRFQVLTPKLASQVDAPASAWPAPGVC